MKRDQNRVDALLLEQAVEHLRRAHVSHRIGDQGIDRGLAGNHWPVIIGPSLSFQA